MPSTPPGPATLQFRAQYRAGIHRLYSPWLHGGFVLAFGLGVLAWLLAGVQGLQAWEWLALPAGALLFNWAEYSVHRHLGHHKRRLGALFYKRHTGDHHSFFDAERMAFEQARDWRVILFPPWLIVLVSAALVLPAQWLLGRLLSPNAGSLFAATLLGGYLLYEFFHACQHLPASHPLTRLPWLRQMRRLHQLHHRRDLMQARNFNLVLPLMDWLHGTLHWEEDPLQMDTVRTTHTLLRTTPEAAFDYLTRPARWREWHHASLGTEAHAEQPMGAGACFREQIRTVGIRKSLQWQVLDAQPGRRWEAHALLDDGSRAQLLYEFEAVPGGTRFSRTLGYRIKPWPLRVLNATVGGAKIRRESRQALRKLQQRFESGPAAPT